MRNKAIVILLIALITGYFFWYRPRFSHSGAVNLATNNVMEVGVMQVQKQPVQLFLELPARVAAYRISEVRPQVDGVIKQQKFVEGGLVKQGQQLYQIDPALYQAAFSDASANFKTARAKRDRYQNLLAEDAVSKQEFDDVSAAFAKAEADLKKAQTNLSYTKVLAPISGYIGKSNFTEGALVTANQANVLVTIAQLDPIYVDMVQPSRDMIKLGDQKEILVNLIIDEVIHKDVGVLKFSEMFADESTDSVRLRALFSNKNKELLPGMFVNAKLNLKPVEAITVPQKATSRAPDGNLSIWVVAEGNVAKPRVIKADQTSGDSWVVKEGLENGDVVIVDGFQKVADGAKVKPVLIGIVKQEVVEQEVSKQNSAEQAAVEQENKEQKAVKKKSSKKRLAKNKTKK